MPQRKPSPAVQIGAGMISQDILAALNGKGYRFFPNRQTDLWVGFHIVLTENESVTTLDNYLGYPLTAGQSDSSGSFAIPGSQSSRDGV